MNNESNNPDINDSRGSSGGWLVGLGLVITLLGSVLFLRTQVPESTAIQATVFEAPRQLPEFELVDQDGSPFSRDSLTGQWSLVFFGFTHCPDICPLTLQTLALTRKKLEQHANAGDVPQIVFISVDPGRDNSDKISDYVAVFGEAVIGVGGQLDALNVLTSALGIFHARPVNTDGGYDVEHSAAVVLINERAEYHALFSAPHTVDSLTSDILQITRPR